MAVWWAGRARWWRRRGALVDGAPVQAVPLSVNAAGTGFDALFHEPLKPKFAVPPVPMAAL
ncbi:hypothetical protein V2I01_01610 [Micromonospora sp. BRA006-A]|nr:hypothetical protein [Micromonospora sp. BRA006-A]